MKTESSVFVILRLLGKILLADLIIFIIVGAVCWFGGWRTLENYGTGLMYGGIGAIMVAGLSALGGTEIARNPTYRYIQSVMSNSLSDRTKQNWLDNLESFSFFAWMGVAGILATAAGYMLFSLRQP